mgnify:CR=1 FL=1
MNFDPEETESKHTIEEIQPYPWKEDMDSDMVTPQDFYNYYKNLAKK